MERIEKMTLEEKRTLTPEEKIIRKKLLKNQYYRDYYKNNKDNYLEYKTKYEEKSGYVLKRKNDLKDKYENDAEFRATKKLTHYKNKHGDNLEIQNIFKKNIKNTEKFREIKMCLLKI